jgi:outer membrane receptor protein involved in Fe transport
MNQYKYSELRSAAYAGMSINIDNLGLQGTLRVENSIVDINKDTTDKYFTFLPSANVMYKFNSKHNVKLTYNRRINRPNINQLNPFEKIGFSDDISSGNPVLKPEYRDKLQFTYTMNIKKSYVSPYLYYEKYSGKVDEYSFIGFSSRLNKETFVRQPGNLLSGSEKGVGLNAMILFVNINFRYFEGQFDEYKNSLKPIAARKYSSYSIGGWAFAPLPWKMNWFAFANYNGSNATAQGTMQSPFFYGTGLRKDFGNHTVGMFYLLPGISRLTVHDNTRTSPDFQAKEKVTFDSSYFIQLQYSYKFNKGRAAKKILRQTEVESDSKKGGLGGPN